MNNIPELIWESVINYAKSKLPASNYVADEYSVEGKTDKRIVYRGTKGCCWGAVIVGGREDNRIVFDISYMNKAGLFVLTQKVDSMLHTIDIEFCNYQD